MSAARSPQEVEAARAAILAGALERAGSDGWTMYMLHRVAAEAGIGPAVVRLAFPGGISDLLRLFCADGDRRMEQALERLEGFAEMPLGRRVGAAARARLEVDEPYRGAVRAALGILLQPFNAALALGVLLRTVDAMWRAAGDTSRDLSFYTKRLTLAGVYAAALIYWLEDDSPGRERSWRFLDERLADVRRIGELRKAAGAFAARAPSPADILAGLREQARRGGLWDRPPTDRKD